MHRPWQIAVVFVAALAVVLAVLGWASVQVLHLDRAEAEARRRAEEEESIRLALWRMDSALATLMAQESARPYFEYSAFYPAERAYTRMFNPIAQGDILLPSPILVQGSPYIILNYQFAPDGALSSPQVPAAGMRALAESGYVTREAVDAATARLDQLRAVVRRDALAAALPGPEERPPAAPALALAGEAEAPPQPPAQGQQQGQPQQQAWVQAKRNVKEWQARAQTSQMANTAAVEQMGLNRDLSLAGVREGVMKPLWLGDTLVLARRVSVAKAEYIQGAWLDWPALRKWLLESVRDLLPQADLVPAAPGQPLPRARREPRLSASSSSYDDSRSAPAEDRSRMLAALPVRLVPGPVPAQAGEGPSPLVLSLIVAWICVTLAGAAVAVLLWGTVSLSERRAAFVSAVTHELRTPLTTFRMYSEMLAGGMVADEAKRLRYLDTLRIEADRLVHLVENVLAYARLERGRAAGRTETIALADLVDRVRGRLADRARQAGFEWVVERPEGGAAAVRADASAVEQILFNLVDNACKYAAGAADKRIHLVAGTAGGRAALKVCDHGPGLSPGDLRRLFRPFSKSARDAAHSAPGVGLGLALSRRLAREMGGDLILEPAPGSGACFVLILPAA